MSKIGCVCGHVIRDQSDALPYKAALVLDIDHEDLTNWMVTELRSYVDAVKNGESDAWLIERGCGSEYLNLKLDHGHILFDLVLSRYGEFEKTVFECSSCGRLLVEGSDNQFFPYTPDSKVTNGVLAMSRHSSAIENSKPEDLLGGENEF